MGQPGGCGGKGGPAGSGAAWKRKAVSGPSQGPRPRASPVGGTLGSGWLGCPRDVTATSHCSMVCGATSTRRLGCHPHPPAAPIRRRCRVLGPRSHVPRGGGRGGNGGSRQAGQPGSPLTCPTHVPASSQSLWAPAAEVPASQRETLLGENPPSTPTPIPRPLAGGKQDGTEPRVAPW